jgi:hypothetical protein
MRKRRATLLETTRFLFGETDGELTKPSNPKEAFGDAKMPLGLLPDTAIVQANLAFLEGALKYGQYNWRIAGVKASTYRRAIGRHLSKWWNGQDVDPQTLVPELASVIACCAIMIDAIECGKFTDDRPPRADIQGSLERAAKTAAHLKQLFKDHNPPQYTEQWVKWNTNTVEFSVKDDRPAPAYVGTGIVPPGTHDPFAGCTHRAKKKAKR